MKKIDITKQKYPTNRKELRKTFINLLLDEDAGTGTGALTSKYVYVTKVLQDGREVLLNRPAMFNKGFDFTVSVSNTNFNSYIKKKRSSSKPTHDNIFHDLKNKKKSSPRLYKQLIVQIELIYNCKRPKTTHFNFKTGHPSDLILECIKWLFIEQDVTYWNYSGRAMLYNGIINI